MTNKYYSTKSINNEHQKNDAPSKWGYRHQQCFILLWVLTIAYSMRSCMGVALVAMVSYKQNNTVGNATEFKTDGFLNAMLIVPPFPMFHWNKKVQDTILASFFWGYMLLQIPAGQLAHRFGAKYLLIGAMGTNCFVSILLPTAAYYGGWYSAIFCRILQGLSQGCILPSLHTALGKWAPLKERARLAAFVYGGQALGTVCGLPITGFISTSSLGWPGIFRFYGMLSGIMMLIIWLFISESPAQHPKISDAERKYIEDDVGSNTGKNMPVPWLKILKHKGALAIVIVHFGHTWGQLTLYSEVPAYMDKVMGMNIKANGLLTALPFLVMWFTNFLYSWVTDLLIVKNIMSVTNARKLANSVGNIGAGVGLIGLAYAPHDIYYVETILVLICALKVCSGSGFHVNHIDISPNYAGTMMSISNFVSNIGASIAPIVIGFILTDVSDSYLWRQVFFLAAGLYLVTNFVYLVIGTSEKADWNDPEQERRIDEENVPMFDQVKCANV